MTNNINPGGAIPSPADPRDYTIARGMEVSGDPLPEKFEVWTPPVANQGRIGNCVAQSLACIMESADHLVGLEHEDRSIGYIYGKSTAAAWGSGMIPRDACDTIINDGDVYAKVWECLEENPACWEKRFFVSEDIKAQAKKMKMYIRLKTEDDMKRFMLKYQVPVMVCVDVPTTYGPMFGEGKHALVCFGWDDSKRRYMQFMKDYVGDNLHLQDSQGTGGMWGDGTRWVNFKEFEEVWGIIPMDEKKFSDVEEGRWSAAAIKWAAENGLLIGYEDGTFRPDKPLTREELAAVLQRLASK